jgi:hypothetical protein
MKTRLMITLITAAVSLSAYADTCPPVDSFDPHTPPAGWSLLLPPIVEGQKYHFDKAIHSLNGNFYYQQIICVYDTCPSMGCPAIELLSNNTYTQPDSAAAPWNAKTPISYTFACQPADNDPSKCVFSAAANAKPK